MVTPGRAARRIGIAVAVFAVVIATAHSPHVMAQGIDPAAPARQAPAQEQAPRFPRVVEALRRAPGCLGVETGQTAVQVPHW